MNNFINIYFTNKEKKLKKELKNISEQHVNNLWAFNKGSKKDFASRFNSFMKIVQSSVYKEQSTHKYWDNLKLAFCFERWSSFSSIMPLTLLFTTGCTEGISLFLYLCLVFGEFWNCQNNSVNLIKRQLIKLDEKNVFKGFLYFYQTNGRLFKAVFSPSMNKKQYRYLTFSNLQVKLDRLYFVFMFNEDDILFLYDLEEQQLLFSHQGNEHFRIYTIFWESSLQNWGDKNTAFVEEFKQNLSLAIQNEMFQGQIDDLKNKLEALPATTKLWLNYIVSEELFHDVMAMIERFEWNKGPPKGILLHGPPGTGKTLLARNIAKTLSCSFYPLSLPDIKSEKVGGSAKRIREIWDTAKINAPSIIFIDECEGVLKSRGHSSADASTEEIIQAILAEWDGICSSDNIWLIAATNRPELIDKAALSRFEREIEMAGPTQEHLMQILKIELQKYKVHYSVNNDLKPYLSNCSGRDLANLAKILSGKSAYAKLTDDLIIDELKKLKKKNKLQEKPL